MRYGLLFLLFFLAPSAYAQSVYFVLSSQTEQVEQALTEVKSRISNKNQHTQYTVLQQNFLIKDLAPNDLVVTIGNQAARYIAELSIANPTIHSFIDSHSQAFIKSNYTNTDVTTISLNQPSQVMVEVADLIVGTDYKDKIVVAVSEQNQSLQSSLASITKLKQGSLDVVVIKEDELAAKVLDQHLFDASVLVAIPDKQIWSGKNAKWVLQQAFNYKVPVIGYSKAFLGAGALAAVYSDIEDIAIETASSIDAWANGKRPKQLTNRVTKTTVTVNEKISRVYKAQARRLNQIKETQ